ncbi:hypothetical protein EG329_011929 [Mollisiaceae sp. DMI_Dod_QoI]|nr:hypothetical protein EG329_011929 [Helotiales sp. DMI_Dod_QoI]
MAEPDFVAIFRATAISKGYSPGQIDQIQQSVMIIVRESFYEALVSLRLDPANASQVVSQWYGWSRDRITWEFLFGDDPSLPYSITEPPRPQGYNRMCAGFDRLVLPARPLPANAPLQSCVPSESIDQSAHHWPWMNENGEIQYAVSLPRGLLSYIFHDGRRALLPIELLFNVKIEVQSRNPGSRIVMWIQARTQAESMQPASAHVSLAYDFIVEYKSRP